MQEIISLNGWWDWSIPGHSSQQREVPSSYLCVGEAVYMKQFELPDVSNKRLLLHFEGVHYTGTVTLNGASIGNMLPYVPYDFDITSTAVTGCNVLEVVIKDLTAHYGPTPGWESYGGITRDVWVEISPLVGLADVYWSASMRDDYSAADATLRFCVYNKTTAKQRVRVTASLRYAETIVMVKTTDVYAVPDKDTSSQTSTNEIETRSVLNFRLDKIYPWSPEFPHLYQLCVTSSCCGQDYAKCLDVGFREFIAQGSFFLLNGSKTFLKGVARHEMWGDDQGFYLSKEQIEHDLMLIKQMGANFVRLVHYPHSRYTIEYAARVGLMVSEEPGLWGGALNTVEIAQDAEEIMRRIVMRDRSNPAVVAWLFFNEVNMDNPSGRDYILNCAKMCRELDRDRLLSGASNMGLAENKRIFDDCGFDFYTQHTYSYDGDFFMEAAKQLRGKPLVYTEWGGWLIHFNPNLIAYYKKLIEQLAHSPDTEPCLAGMCWWQWQDIYETMRGLHGCIDNILTDGLVDRYRNRKASYTMMSEIFDIIDKKPDPLFSVIECSSYNLENASVLEPVCLADHYGQHNDALWREACISDREPKSPSGSFGRKQYIGIYMHREIRTIAGLRVAIPQGYTLILRGDRKLIEAEIGKKTQKVFLFGGVTFWDGYPIRGVHGEAVARVKLKYSDGRDRLFLLRHGLEITSASLLAKWSRLDARAAHAPRLAQIVLDHDFESYAMNLITLDTEPDIALDSICVESIDDRFDPVIYAISTLCQPCDSD